jgi:hypothetical protein
MKETLLLLNRFFKCNLNDENNTSKQQQRNRKEKKNGERKKEKKSHPHVVPSPHRYSCEIRQQTPQNCSQRGQGIAYNTVVDLLAVHTRGENVLLPHSVLATSLMPPLPTHPKRNEEASIDEKPDDFDPLR